MTTDLDAAYLEEYELLLGNEDRDEKQEARFLELGGMAGCNYGKK